MTSDPGDHQRQTAGLHAILARLAHERAAHAEAKVSPGFLRYLLPTGAPIELTLLGRMLLHAGLVGVGAGLVGAGFFAALE